MKWAGDFRKDKTGCQSREPIPVLLGVWLPGLRASSETEQLVTLGIALPKCNTGRLWPGLSLLPLGPALKWSLLPLVPAWLHCSCTAAMPVHCLTKTARKKDLHDCVWHWQQQKLPHPIMRTSVITFESANPVPY